MKEREESTGCSESYFALILANMFQYRIKEKNLNENCEQCC